MTLYNVHIYREMRLTYGGIEAKTPEAAAAIARERLTTEADGIEDCDGESFGAVVDVAGDEGYERSVAIDFMAERLRKAAELLVALQEISLALAHYRHWLPNMAERLQDVARKAIARAAEAFATSIEGNAPEQEREK